MACAARTDKSDFLGYLQADSSSLGKGAYPTMAAESSNTGQLHMN